MTQFVVESIIECTPADFILPLKTKRDGVACFFSKRLDIPFIPVPDMRITGLDRVSDLFSPHTVEEVIWHHARGSFEIWLDDFICDPKQFASHCQSLLSEMWTQVDRGYGDA
jgi:hypothetical protein